MTRRTTAVIAATMLVLCTAAAVPAAAEIVTIRFNLTPAPLGIFGIEFTADYFSPVDEIAGGEIVSTRFHLEYDSTVEPNPLEDAATLAIQFQPPAGKLPIFTLSGADLGWSGMGQFTGDVETDVLNLPILDFPPDAEFALWFVRIINLDEEVLLLGGQLSNSYIEVDVDVPPVPATSIPVALEIDPGVLVSDGNGIFEPGELIEVAPSWRNDDTDPLTLSGTASGFGGPDGAVYTLALDGAEYGLLDPGQTADCLELGVCYWLGVNGSAVRPATHWETTFEETLSDGATHTWNLHLGDSFLDVPRSSPFYPAIETLLHHGVTDGCTTTEYCPAGTVTRGQTAVFLLRAVEDADYAPPACVEGEARFADVPFDDPLCPWIEELAERGVTSGCGGDDYCPGGAVTRAQMAVFLLKAFEGGDYAPPECTGELADVTCPSTFAAWIEELSARGITGGCGADSATYCPTAPVTRAQMAAFVTRTFGLTLYGP